MYFRTYADIINAAKLKKDDAILNSIISSYLVYMKLRAQYFHMIKNNERDIDFESWIIEPANKTLIDNIEISAEDIVAYRLTKYSELREAYYPDYTEYLDAVVKNDTEQIEAYRQQCLLVKERFPKE